MEIRVDRVALRLRGVPVATARAAVEGLPEELARRLSGPPRGHMAVPRAASATQVRAVAAAELAHRIREEVR